MFNKLKNVVDTVVDKAGDLISIDKIEDMLSSKFSDLVSSVLDERREDKDNSSIQQENINEVVHQYVIKNVAVATATSFIPGPAGLLASIPNLVVSVGNQMRSVYDISCAYDKETIMNKDLLLDIPLHSMGIPSGLAGLQEAKELMESPQEVLTQKATGLGKVLVVKKLKKSLTGIVPGMGTVVAIVQAKMETAKIAASSIAFFDPSEVISDPIIDTSIPESDIELERIKSLINLMTLDSKASPKEEKFVLPIIEASSLEIDIKKEFIGALKSSKTDYTVDYEIIFRSGTGEDMVADLAVLTKRDGKIGPRELEYVKFAAEKLDIHPLIYTQLLD